MKIYSLFTRNLHTVQRNVREQGSRGLLCKHKSVKYPEFDSLGDLKCNTHQLTLLKNVDYVYIFRYVNWLYEMSLHNTWTMHKPYYLI